MEGVDSQGILMSYESVVVRRLIAKGQELAGVAVEGGG